MGQELKMSTDLELAWAAGFFDGEGCIYLRNDKRDSRWQLLLGLAQVDKAPLEDFQRIVGGVGYITKSHRGKGNQRSCWTWQAASKNAGDVVELLLPFLRVKQSQAVAALEFRATFPKKPYRRYRRIPLKILYERDRLARKVKALKLVGMHEEVEVA